ncbi:rho GTPase-activating protein 12 isoform X1 [Scleropages formosus]|uniref:Rho GTPase activating protein 27, like n=1 Tax=Scleropages formosus TaxID=113540 RepID=A0A8C9SHM2_SCLFO|nr:rho GTPase-activating protein 12-like isoform X1 [Scleropages formosus]XP_018620157.1 rho GTPase-activating protein 12-like isoform X1 [Scleropages formosus]XP_018620158.1 rho GTPase-activating protein 12-like isoform X1 [Scleropages formosus]
MAGMKNMGLVLVEFEFDYMDRDGDLVSIKPNERYILLSKTNDHWWQVRRDDRAKPFYIPATYVKELPSDLPLPLDFMEPASQVVAKPRHDKTVADVAGDRRDEVTIRARPQNHYKKAENRMSTFGVPLDVHGSVFHWGGLADSSVALQPHEHVPVAPGHSRDSPQHAKRSGPAPSSLLSSQSHVEDPLHLSQKSRVPGVSPTDLLVKLSQAKQVEPPVIKDVQVTPPAQECDDKAKPPAELLETTCVDSKQPEDTENIYESISDMEGLQPKNFPLSELGLFVTPPPAPAQPPPPPPSSQVDNDGPSASLYANVMELRTNVPQTPTLASFTSSSLHQNPGTNPFSAPMDQDLPPDLSTPPDLLIPAPPPPSYPAPLGPDIKLASDGTARQHFQIRPPAEPQDQQRAQDNGPPPLPKEDYPADEHGSHGTQEPEFPVFQKDYSPLWPAGIPRATVDPGTLTSWGRTHDPRGKTVVTGVPQHEQLQTLSNQPKLGNGTEDAVPIVKNWRHTLGPSYFAAAPEETNFVPTHRRKASDYTNELPSSGSSGELHQHTHGLEKAGIINKTKVSENGKRLRKNWSQSWTVLHDGILTFHKDPRFAPAGMSKSNQIVPEYTVDLRGATICKAPKEKSSKKNVLEIRTRNGSEYLMQYDTDTIISDWYKVIEDTIRQLDLNHHTEDDGEESSDKSSGAADKDDKDKKKIPTKQSPVASSTAAESEQGRVRNKLRKFLLRRPTLQAVKEKGYIRDNVFGCHLDTLCHRENATVPSFVEKCIASVEKRGLDIDGIYRVSGNLAVIQKLRYKADHEENLDLEDGQWEEIHVITGALKLFFRELPEPLFPFSHFDGFIAAIKLQDYSQKVSYICDLVKSLPLPNHDTMKLLFQHLRKVIEFRDVNRMSVQSVAIVFGPTLLRPETESSNITVHMVYQTQIVELILNQFEQIFQSN